MRQAIAMSVPYQPYPATYGARLVAHFQFEPVPRATSTFARLRPRPRLARVSFGSKLNCGDRGLPRHSVL
jgi:hypothetical protein